MVVRRLLSAAIARAWVNLKYIKGSVITEMGAGVGDKVEGTVTSVHSKHNLGAAPIDSTVHNGFHHLWSTHDMLYLRKVGLSGHYIERHAQGRPGILLWPLCVTAWLKENSCTVEGSHLPLTRVGYQRRSGSLRNELKQFDSYTYRFSTWV